MCFRQSDLMGAAPAPHCCNCKSVLQLPRFASPHVCSLHACQGQAAAAPHAAWKCWHSSLCPADAELLGRCTGSGLGCHSGSWTQSEYMLASAIQLSQACQCWALMTCGAAVQVPTNAAARLDPAAADLTAVLSGQRVSGGIIPEARSPNPFADEARHDFDSPLVLASGAPYLFLS